MAVAVPQESLSPNAFSAKSQNVYSGLMTGFDRRATQDQKVVYLVPDSSGQVFSVMEATDLSDTSLQSSWGTLRCDSINNPLPGFCSGTLTRDGVSGSGNAACLFSWGDGMVRRI